MAIVLKSQFKMKKTLFIACLSLLSIAAVAANNNKTVAQSKKQSGKQLPALIHCRYTTTCGPVIEFDMTPEQMAVKSNLGGIVAVFNDADCGTHWWMTEVFTCPCPDPK